MNGRARVGGVRAAVTVAAAALVVAGLTGCRPMETRAADPGSGRAPAAVSRTVDGPAAPGERGLSRGAADNTAPPSGTPDGGAVTVRWVPLP